MMKKITKLVTLLLALAMVFSLAACSSGKGKDKANGSADIAALIATEPNSADEAAKLYQQLMQKENDILAANSELWNKVFLSANKNSTMIEDGTNYGDFLLATIESAKDGFSADELKTLKAGAEQIKEIEGKLTILEQKYPGCGTAPGAGDSVSAEEAGMTASGSNAMKFPSFQGKDLDGNDVDSSKLFAGNSVTVVNSGSPPATRASVSWPTLRRSTRSSPRRAARSSASTPSRSTATRPPSPRQRTFWRKRA